jgi:nucleoid-associated protein YgaU
MNWTKRIEEQRQRTRRLESRLKKAALIALVAGAAAVSLGFGHSEVREEIYIVKAGDTFWDISEAYLAKNTGSRKYILEFQHELQELNPWLAERHYRIQAGDKILVRYEEATK